MYDEMYRDAVVSVRLFSQSFVERVALQMS